MLNDVNSSGIYEIRNSVNDKVYIGSAYNFKKRWAVHVSTLKNGSHDNPHLQLSVNKYGMELFKFSILEICDIEQLESREQFHIDRNFGPNCYNINRSVECRHMNSRFIKEYTLVSPDDDVISISGTIVDVSHYVYETMKDTTLQTIQIMIGKVLSGKRLHYKGWRLIVNKDIDWKTIKFIRKYKGKTYSVSLTSPDGTVYDSITNLTQFSKTHNLPKSALHSVIGKHTQYYKGWHLTDNIVKEKNSKVYDCILESPDGVIYDGITNITKFAREQGLSQSGLRNFIMGKLKSYKNWKIIKELENE